MGKNEGSGSLGNGAKKKKSLLKDQYTELVFTIGYFNWTMNYRDDSDIPIPYGYIGPNNHTITFPLTWSNMTWMDYNNTEFKNSLESR